jgi:F-type H+-transporting ATPase subunit b
LKSSTVKSPRIACALAVALLLAGMVAVPVYAQEKSASQEPKQKGSDSARQQQGPAQQLVRQSNEAAGRDTGNKEEEKDETAEFKQSASVQMIAKITGLDLRQAYWLSVGLNFAVIAGIIVWAARKYLPGLLRARTAAIQKAMQEAQKASAEARAKLAEIEARLAKMDAQIATMREAAEKDGAAEEARLQAAAQEDAQKIVAAAEQEITAAAKAARRQLTAYAADLAVGLAQKQIRVDAATDQALVRNFAGQLSTASEDGGKDRN